MSEFPDSGSISIEELKNFIESNLGLNIENVSLQEIFEIMKQYNFDLPNADIDENNNSQAFIEPHKMSEIYGMRASKIYDGIDFGDHAYEIEMIRNQSGAVDNGPYFNFDDFIYYYPITVFDHYSDYSDFDPGTDSIFLFSPVCSVDAESVIKPGITENPLDGTYTILEFTVYHPKIVTEEGNQIKYLPLPRHLVERWKEPDPDGARLDNDTANSLTIDPGKQSVLLKQIQLQETLGQTFFDYQSLPSDRLGYDTMEKIKTFVKMGDLTERDSQGNIISDKFISKGASFLPMFPDLDPNDPAFNEKLENPSMSNVQVKFISGSRHAVKAFFDQSGNLKYKVVDETDTIQYISDSQQEALDYWRINFYEQGEFFQSSGSDKLYDWVHVIGVDWAMRGTSSSTRTILISVSLMLSFRGWYGYSELSLNEDVEDDLSFEHYPLGTAFPEYGLTQPGLHISSQYIVDLDDFAKSQIELAISKIESIIKNKFSFNILFLPMSPQRLGGALAGARPIFRSFTSRSILKTLYHQELITSLQDISKYKVIVDIFGNAFKVTDNHDGSFGSQRYAYIDIDVDPSTYYKLEFDASNFINVNEFYVDVYNPVDGPISDDPENEIASDYVYEGDQVSLILFTKALTTIRIAFLVIGFAQTYEMSFVVENLSLKKCEVYDRVNAGACFLDEIDLKSEKVRRIIHDDKSAIYYLTLHELVHALGVHSGMWAPNQLNLVTQSGYPTQYLGPYGNAAYAQNMQNKIYDLGLNLLDYYFQTAPVEGGTSSHLAEFAKNYGSLIQPTFSNELMSTYYNSDQSSAGYERLILSTITLGFLDDVGYTVDYTQAEGIDLLKLSNDTSISNDPENPYTYDMIASSKGHWCCR